MRGLERAINAAGMFTNQKPVEVNRFGSGHINETYRITGDGFDLTLQKLSAVAFKKPIHVMDNIVMVTDFLKDKIEKAGRDPFRETLNTVKAVDGKNYYIDEWGDFWRCFGYIPDALSYETIENAGQLYELGKAIGRFQNLLSDFPAEKLSHTIKNFHHTPTRLEDFKTSIKEDVLNRAKDIMPEIEFALEREKDASVITNLIESGEIPLRVTHNDTKLNNVLMDSKTGEAICVIDLDTVMPGSALYDFGDGIRSAVNPAAEDERDLSLICVNDDYYEKFVSGYMSEMKELLTKAEVEYLAFSTKLIAYELGMRFLTDHLNGDVYFRIHRENHNLDRARTQLKLVAEIEKKMSFMKKVVEKCTTK